MKKKIIILMFIFVFVARLEGAFTINDPGEINLPSIDGVGDLITITTSNVIVNLQGAIISGATRAIVINPNLSNVIIKNGTIANSTIGISINGNCSNIRLENLEITNCSGRAIETLASSGNTISNLFMEHIKISQCSTGVSADVIVTVTFCSDVLINDLLINQSGASGLSLTGVNIQTSTRCCIENVKIARNTCTTFTGFAINASIDCSLENCSVITNTTADALTGFVIVGGGISGNVINNCQCSNNISVNGPVSGFELLPFVTRNIIRDCLVSNNLVTGAVASANFFGFNLDQPTFCSIIDCRVENNRITGDGTTNICVGFNVGTSGVGTTGTKNCELCNSRATFNNGFNDDRSFGIRPLSLDDGNVDNLYIFNIAARNGPTAPLQENQVVTDGGAGSNPGGVPGSSVANRNLSNLNFDVQYGNVRIS